MKIKNKFIMKKIGEDTVVVPVGDNDLRGVIKLNEVAADMWSFSLENDDNQSIAEKIAEKYDVSVEKALEDVIKFEEKLKENGICQ